MDCKKLLRVFEKCASPPYAFPKNPQEIIANEAHLHNCVLLSDTLRKQCMEILKKQNPELDLGWWEEK
jgi:hypothetical protein